MQRKTQGLTNYQITVIVTVSIIGLIVLSLPRLAASDAGIDGIFATAAAGILSLVLAGFIILLSSRFPNQTVIEYSQEILGKFLGRLYGAAFAFYAFLTGSVIIRGFADAMKVLLLQRTPIELIMIAMIFISIYCTVGGINTIARVSELFLPPTIAVIGIIILFNLSDVELFRFRKVFHAGWMPILRGIFNVTIAYLGYEILFFLSPFTKNKNKLLPYGLAGLILPTLVYTGLVFVTLGINGEMTTSDLIYPTAQLARRINLLGAFIERLDIFFIMFWILAVFTSAVIFLYIASLSVTRLAGLRNYKPFIFILAPVVYLFAILPQNIVQINFLAQVANYIGLLMVSSSIPLLLLSVIRKKGGKHHG